MSHIKAEDFLTAITESMSPAAVLSAMIKGEIAAVISVKRQELGMNQKEFAVFMGVSQGLVSRWETGETNFTIDTLVELAQKLSIEINSPISLGRPLRYLDAGKIVSISGGWSGVASRVDEYTMPEELREM